MGETEPAWEKEKKRTEQKLELSKKFKRKQGHMYGPGSFLGKNSCFNLRGTLQVTKHWRTVGFFFFNLSEVRDPSESLMEALHSLPREKSPMHSPHKTYTSMVLPCKDENVLYLLSDTAATRHTWVVST